MEDYLPTIPIMRHPGFKPWGTPGNSTDPTVPMDFGEAQYSVDMHIPRTGPRAYDAVGGFLDDVRSLDDLNGPGYDDTIPHVFPDEVPGLSNAEREADYLLGKQFGLEYTDFDSADYDEDTDAEGGLGVAA